MEVAETRRSKVGDQSWPGSSGLAHRVLRDGNGVPRRYVGCSSWRRGPDLPASRKRDRTIGGCNRQNLRAILDARALSARGRSEDVEEPRQLLYASRPDSERSQAFVDSLSALICSISKAAQLYLRRFEAGGKFCRTAAQFQDTSRYGTISGWFQFGNECTGEVHEREDPSRARRRLEHGASAGGDLRHGSRGQCCR